MAARPACPRAIYGSGGPGGVAGSRAGCVLLPILISAAVAAGWLLDSAILALNLTMHSAASTFMLLLNDSVQHGPRSRSLELLSWSQAPDHLRDLT